MKKIEEASERGWPGHIGMAGHRSQAEIWERSILGTETVERASSAPRRGCERAGRPCVLRNRAEKGKEGAKEAETWSHVMGKTGRLGTQRLHAQDREHPEARMLKVRWRRG